MDNFEILEEIGKGSYSTVYKVKCIKDNNFFALKREKNNDFSNVNEIDFLSRCRHPYIINLIEIFYTYNDNNTFSNLILPLAEFDLKTFIRKSSHYSYSYLILMYQIASALEFIHSNNLFYGDLKPTNILIFIDKDKIVPKLSDFNLMFPLDCNLGFIGSPLFTSPQGLEYHHKNKKNDLYFQPINYIQADIFALGCVFLFIYLKGKHISDLFNSLNFSITDIYNHYIINYSSLLFNHINNKQLLDLLLKMMCPSQDDRFQTVSEVLNHTFFKDKIPKEIEEYRGQGIMLNVYPESRRKLDYSLFFLVAHPKLSVKENSKLIKTIKQIFIRCRDLEFEDIFLLAGSFFIGCKYHNLLKDLESKEIAKFFKLSYKELLDIAQSIIMHLNGMLFY
jgi:serine/threonine protein kinase